MSGPVIVGALIGLGFALITTVIGCLNVWQSLAVIVSGCVAYNIGRFV